MIPFPKGTFKTIFILATIGGITVWLTVLGGIGFGVYWLIQHVRFV